MCLSMLKADVNPSEASPHLILTHASGCRHIITEETCLHTCVLHLHNPLQHEQQHPPKAQPITRAVTPPPSEARPDVLRKHAAPNLKQRMKMEKTSKLLHASNVSQTFLRHLIAFSRQNVSVLHHVHVKPGASAHLQQPSRPHVPPEL